MLHDKVPLSITEHAVHEITAGHRSLSGTISCVTDRIRFLPVTMTGRFSNFNSISYTEDRHELRVTGTKCRLPDIVSGTGEIFISGAECSLSPCPTVQHLSLKVYWFSGLTRFNSWIVVVDDSNNFVLVWLCVIFSKMGGYTLVGIDRKEGTLLHLYVISNALKVTCKIYGKNQRIPGKRLLQVELDNFDH